MIFFLTTLSEQSNFFLNDASGAMQFLLNNAGIAMQLFWKTDCWWSNFFRILCWGSHHILPLCTHCLCKFFMIPHQTNHCMLFWKTWLPVIIFCYDNLPGHPSHAATANTITGDVKFLWYLTGPATAHWTTWNGHYDEFIQKMHCHSKDSLIILLVEWNWIALTVLLKKIRLLCRHHWKKLDCANSVI